MTELILHHFPASPFAEKVRLVLGFKGLAWRSVVVPAIMPKPDVIALTGGYRRTPFLQIGADIYCDTALICEVLERLQPAPTLHPAGVDPLARMLAQWADSTLFWAAVTYNRGDKGAGDKFGGTLTDLPSAIFADRKAMGFDVEWLQPGDAACAYQSYVSQLSELLRNQPYLFGQRPSIADFSAFHPLWLVHVRAPATLGILESHATVRAWLDRMQAIGHASSDSLQAAQAIAIAAAVEPMPLGNRLLPDNVFQDEHGIDIGSRVTITAESFGREPTAGVLVAATSTHYSLRRTDARAGAVHVHFPRIGYLLKRLEP